MFVFSGNFKFETGLLNQNLHCQLLGSFLDTLNKMQSWMIEFEREHGYKINNTRITERYQLESGL